MIPKSAMVLKICVWSYLTRDGAGEHKGRVRV